MLDKKDELTVQDSVCEEFGMCSTLQVATNYGTW